jgi:uncharacterized protein (DUF1499 family)
MCAGPEKAVVTASSLLSRAAFLLALVSALAAILSGVGSRAGWWHFTTGFQILTWAAYGGLGSALLGAIGTIAALWQRQTRNVMIAFLSLALGLVGVGIPWQMKRTAQSVPAIHDISTDTEDPPQFVALLPLRKDAPNGTAYGGPDIAVQQHQAYPDIQPLILRVPREKAFDQALKAIDAMGWAIIDASPTEGRIEATDTTFWFGFKDDIVVRIRAQGDVSRVDVRSVSRVGRSDVGTNAKRIRTFERRLTQAR